MAIESSNVGVPGVTMPNTAMPSDISFGLSHMWNSGDTVTHIVALLLLGMSICSWFWIVLKAWHWMRLRTMTRSLDGFWAAAGFKEGLQQLQRNVPNTPVSHLALSAGSAIQHFDDCERREGHASWALDRGEFLTRALRQSMLASQARLERGLTFLASIGATAPFVGLFGTVWGIYHALVAVSVSGQATLDKVAGPVGEALIMTAAGIGVALPAVLAYNAFTRVNRITICELDGFAHDLHAHLTTGGRVQSATSTSATPLRVAAGAA